MTHTRVKGEAVAALSTPPASRGNDTKYVYCNKDQHPLGANALWAWHAAHARWLLRDKKGLSCGKGRLLGGTALVPSGSTSTDNKWKGISSRRKHVK